jgi:murein DD-endopeptidase MepM/ murein hydrolase activator NlpD
VTLPLSFSGPACLSSLRIPSVANHRAEKRAVSRRRSGGGPGRQAGGHVGGRKNLFPALPSTPSLVGIAALALAATGAVAAGHQGLTTSVAAGSFHKLSSQASVLNGASSIGSSSALTGRHRAVSRDSEREALQEAADRQLQSAAEQQAKERNAALEQLAASAQKHAAVIARNAWQLPVQPGVYHLTARFGQCSGLWSHCHTGLDFAAAPGTPIHAIANGVVTSVGYEGSYGNQTVVTLSDGTQMWYCHQSSSTVSSGEHVRAGQLIGYVGSTGNTTGPHLHLEVRPGGGDPVDPYTALLVHGLRP